MSKDLEVLKKITRDGLIWVGGSGHEFRHDKDILPKNKIKCRNNLCNSNDVVAIEKCYLFASRKKGLVARCHKCGKVVIVPAEVFNETFSVARPVVKKRIFPSTVEEVQRNLMRLNGCEEEDIEAKCEFYKEEWAKEDRKNRIESANFRAENAAKYAEQQRQSEAKSFKEKLDAGIYAFDRTARAFYEVSTGKVVRKL